MAPPSRGNVGTPPAVGGLSRSASGSGLHAIRSLHCDKEAFNVSPEEEARWSIFLCALEARGKKARVEPAAHHRCKQQPAAPVSPLVLGAATTLVALGATVAKQQSVVGTPNNDGSRHESMLAKPRANLVPKVPKALGRFRALAGKSDKLLGLNFIGVTPQRMIVRTVTAAKWANSNGVTIGDELLAVNGQKVKSMTKERITAVLQASNRPTELMFVRGGGFLSAGVEDRPLGLHTSGKPPQPVFIEHVKPGSWGERAGVVAGSELLAVNGTNISAMDNTVFSRHILCSRDVQLLLVAPDADPKPCIDPDADNAATIIQAGWRGKKTRQEIKDTGEAVEFIEAVAGISDEHLGLPATAFPPDPMTIKTINKEGWSAHNGLSQRHKLVAIGDQGRQTMTKDDVLRHLMAFRRISWPRGELARSGSA